MLLLGSALFWALFVYRYSYDSNEPKPSFTRLSIPQSNGFTVGATTSSRRPAVVVVILSPVMLMSIHCITYQITPTHALTSLPHHRLPAFSLPSKPYRRFPLPILSSSSAVSTGATESDISEEGEENDYDFVREKETASFNLDDPLELAEFKRLQSPVVEVKQLDELPEQWRRSRLAWLCKELPAHRSATFIRVLNAQRKWIRQDDCTYIAVHCMRIRENESAFRVYKWMVQQHWFRFDFALATKLADYMGRERKYLKCREIFNDIINQGLVPNESTFHILIVAYLSSSAPGCLEEACTIYNQAIHLGNYKPRLSLHNSLFRALVSKTGGSCRHHLKQAEFIFQNLTTSGLKVGNDIYAGLIWLHSYQDVIDKERIMLLRREMKSLGIEETTEVFVSVLRACAKLGDVAEAETIWSNILSTWSKPPTQAFVYLMEVYSMVGKAMKSLEIFRVMQEQSSPNVVSYYKIIEVLCKAHEIELVESLMEEFINSGMKSLTRSFIDMMNMYLNLSLHDKVECTFYRCLETCHPNQTVYNLYLDSLVQSGNLDKAEEIFGQMLGDEAIGVNAQSFNNILRGYLTYEHLAKAKKIYDLMCQKRYEIESSLMEKLEHVKSLSDNEVKKPTVLKLSLEQREILIGLLIGGLRVQFCEEKRSYGIDFLFKEDNKIHSFLKRHIYNQFHEWLSHKTKIDNDVPHRFTTIPHSSFQLYADQFFPVGSPVIPKLIQRWLTPRVLAYWYMYGGYRTSNGDILLRLKFDKDDVVRVAKAMKAKSLNCRVKSRGKVFWLGFLGSDAGELWKVIESFVLADLKEFVEPNDSSNSDSDGNASDYSDDDDGTHNRL